MYNHAVCGLIDSTDSVTIFSDVIVDIFTASKSNKLWLFDQMGATICMQLYLIKVRYK